MGPEDPEDREIDAHLECYKIGRGERSLSSVRRSSSDSVRSIGRGNSLISKNEVDVRHHLRSVPRPLSVIEDFER